MIIQQKEGKGLVVSSLCLCIVHPRTVWLDITNQFSLVITRLDALESFQFGDIYIYWGEERRERILNTLSLLFPSLTFWSDETRPIKPSDQ